MPDSTQKTLEIEELNSFRTKAKECDADLFSEQRTNILIRSGKQYTNRKNSYNGTSPQGRVLSDQDVSREMKLRITQNNIQKIQQTSLNALMSFCPDVVILPANKAELKDQKVAEMHSSVWRDVERRKKIKAKKRRWGQQYLDIGEVFVKVFWDPNAGPMIKPIPLMNEETGLQEVDEMGNGRVDYGPAGDLVVEDYFAFNVLRDSAADSIEESPILALEKLKPTKELLAMVGGPNDERARFITPASQGNNDTYRVFDAVTGEYRDLKDQTLLVEYYIRPCNQFPTGYYIFATTLGKLFEGPLPEGAFPIKYAGYEEVPTSARCISNIRHTRPYQAELNRCVSKMAEHQITLGDDKIATQGPAKMNYGSLMPGVRHLQLNGGQATVIPGRTGNQYLEYAQWILEQMYSVSPYREWQEDKAQTDPFMALFTSAKQRLRFSIFAEKFEDFYIDIVETCLRLIKLYGAEEMVVKSVGAGDKVNMPEFKSSEDIFYQVKVDRQSGDIESTMGKQLCLNQLIQYGGDKLNSADFGVIARKMPYLTGEDLFEDLTTNYDSATNDILLLDRGGMPKIRKYDDHAYIIKRLIARCKKTDFETLAPQIQMNYEQLISMHEQVQANNIAEVKRQESEFIPMDGPLVKVYGMYDENGELEKLPLASIVDLKGKLKTQGFEQMKLATLGPAATSDVYNMAQGHQPRAPGMGPPNSYVAQ